MPRYFYTYGSSPDYPFKNGWTEVIALNRGQADAFFRAAHPDIHPGILNCAIVYSEAEFAKSVMMKKTNFGAGCHETLGILTYNNDSNPSKHKAAHTNNIPDILKGQLEFILDECKGGDIIITVIEKTNKKKEGLYDI